MKFKSILPVLFLLCSLAFGQENPGWVTESIPTDSPKAPTLPAGSLDMGAFDVSGDNLSPDEAARSLGKATPTELVGNSVAMTATVGNEADFITDEIRALARGLRNDPVKIYEYVYNYIDYECYYGSKKGAQLTLMEKSGNDMDQAALLVALLRAAGYTPRYVYAPCAFPISAYPAWWGISPTPYADVSDAAIIAEYNLASPDTATLANYRLFKAISTLAYLGGYYNAWPSNVGGKLCVSIPYTYVEVMVHGAICDLSPAYKAYTRMTGINLGYTSDYDRTNFLATAGGSTGSPDYVSGLNESGIDALLNTYSENLITAFRDTHENSVKELLGGREITKKSFIFPRVVHPLPGEPPLPPDQMYQGGNLVQMIPDISAMWENEDYTNRTRFEDNILPEYMSKLVITAGETGTYNASTDTFSGTLYNQEITMPSLQGKKLSLSFSGTDNSTATIRLDDIIVGQSFTVSGADVQIRLKAKHGYYDLVPNATATPWSPPTRRALNHSDQSFTAKYVKGASNAYAFIYSFANADRQLRSRQQKLSALRMQTGVADWQLATESMNVMGLTYFKQVRNMENACGVLYDCIPTKHHAFGRAAQENGSFYIDVGLVTSSPIQYTMKDDVRHDFVGMSMLFTSAMEHGVIEQTQGTGARAISTVRLIQQANAAGQRLYRATNSNKTSVINALTAGTYSTASTESIKARLATLDDVMLLPQSGTISVGTQTMGGYAYEGKELFLMLIANLNGGYNATGSGYSPAEAAAVYDSDPVGQLSQSTNFPNATYQPIATQGAYSKDPIEMASGAFVLDKTDLVLGGGDVPRGLALARQYHSNRNSDKRAGLGYGWTHNNDVSITERSAPEALMGGANDYQMVPFLAAAIVAKDLHDGQANAKTWATCALAVHWGVECMKYSAVSVSIGTKTLQFIRMPNGTFIAPPGLNLTLTKNTSNNYELTERNGNTWKFNANKQLASIINSNGAKHTFSYNSNKHLVKVTDDFGRSLTYNWSYGHINSINDGTGRQVSFYHDSLGNMTRFTDPEGKYWYYHYDSSRRMDWMKDPNGSVIAENDYDSSGRVTAQRSMGDANRQWTYVYADMVNTETDPVGGITQYLHDERGRNVGIIDPLRHSSVFAYDGQDRKRLETSKEGAMFLWIYDADNNIIFTEDELDNVTGYYYDNQFQLEQMWDKRGYSTTYTHNAYHQLESATDPLGHNTSYTYTAKGQLQSVTNGESKSINYAYDTYGAVSKITSHDGTFQSLTNNSRGDVLTSTDAKNRTTTNTWNKRRQLLTTTLPEVPGQPAAIVTNAYDNSGNLQSTTDAKGNATVHTWNALGKPLTVTHPALPAGNNVLTTTYDNLNLATTVTNSLNHSATTEYDCVQRPVAYIDALNGRTENILDANGRLTQTTDPLGRVTQFTWNARGEKTRTTNPLNDYVDSTLDGNGNQTVLRNYLANNYTFVYDQANRPTSITAPTGKVTAMTYFNDNLVKTITEPSTQTTTFAYNGKNLVSSKTDPTGTITYGYDNSGLLETVTENSAIITRTYDERARLKTFTNSDGDLIQYQYDSNNNLTRLTYPPDAAHPAGKQVNYTYNARNLLETVTDWSNRVTTYQYDRLGRLTGITRPNGTSNQIAHDAANHLISIKESAGGKLFSYLSFTHDAAGQVKSRFQAPLVTQPWQQPTFTATYDDDNRLASVNGTSVTHDADGNMTYGPIRSDSGIINLAYNSRNQLTNAPGISYTYDSEGRRRTLSDSSGVTRDVVAPSGQLLIRYHPDNTKTYYVYGLGLLYEANEADATKTYHFDQVGSTIARTNDAGSVIGRAAYSAYGLITSKEGDMATLFLYNGQAGVQTDANGLLNMRARYYSPYLMRFLNADPSGFSGGSNWFSFADGNPISLSDPFGLCAEAYACTGGYGKGSQTAGYVGYVLDSIDLVPSYIADHGADSFMRNITDPKFVAINALGGMGFGGITGGISRTAEEISIAANTELTVYRVFGGDARAQGFSWTTTYPESVSNFRNVAGLPSGGASGSTNTAEFMIQGKVNISDVITFKSADPLDGNVGGLPELIIDSRNVRINDFSVIKP
jgi:RHS repeat-associated protein